jgi:ABC-type phosphate transport system substrate-binding protein
MPWFASFDSPTLLFLFGPNLRMRFLRIATLLAFLLTLLTPCFAEPMAVVINKENKVDDIMGEYLGKIFRSEVKKWPNRSDIILVLHARSASEKKMLEHLTNTDESLWEALVAAHKNTIKMATSDAQVIKIVRSTPGAIGLVDVRSVDKTVNIVRVDHKLPQDSEYSLQQ